MENVTNNGNCGEMAGSGATEWWAEVEDDRQPPLRGAARHRCRASLRRRVARLRRAKMAMSGLLEWMARDCGAEGWVKSSVLDIWARAEISYGENPPFEELVVAMAREDEDTDYLGEVAYRIQEEQPDLWRRAEEGYDSLPDDY